MTLQQCRYLVEIAKHDSISKASSCLNVTQPSISKAIKELEDDLEIVILDRTNKGVGFTPRGQELLFYARALIEQADSLIFHFEKKRSVDFAKMTISSQHYGFAIEATARLITYLKDKKYEMTIREGKTTDVIEDVFSGRSIIGVLSISNLNKELFDRYFVSKSLVFTQLRVMKQHVFLRKEHPLARLESVSLDQLKIFPCLTYHQDDIPLYFAEEPININTVSRIVYLKDRGAMNNIIANTDAYNIGTGCIVENYMNPNIVSRPLEGQNEIRVGWIKRYDQLISDEIALYIEFLTKSLNRSAPRQG